MVEGVGENQVCLDVVGCAVEGGDGQSPLQRSDVELELRLVL